MEGLTTMQSPVLPPLSYHSVLFAPAYACFKLPLKIPVPFQPLRPGYVGWNLRTHCCASALDTSLPPFDISVLEYYTEKVPAELLLVRAIIDEEEDEVLVYKGHSSSLMRPTSADLGVAILPPDAVIEGIDRMKGPYNPNRPQYIETGLSWGDFLKMLKSRGL